MIFLNLFHRSFERGRFISDGYYLTTLPFLCQLLFSCFLIWVLTGAARHDDWHCLSPASEKDFSLRSK